MLWPQSMMISVTAMADHDAAAVELKATGHV